MNDSRSIRNGFPQTKLPWFFRINFPHAHLAMLLALTIGCGTQPTPRDKVSQTNVLESRELTVAAASDLKFVLDEIISDFERQVSQVHIKATYGSSGNFFAQLSNKAPFDVFLSADVAYPQKLAELGLADSNSLFSYAIGSLVVWVPNASTLNVEQDGVNIINDPSVKKIAIANPKHAPYGRAAEAALKQLGVYDQSVSRFVLGENVAQTALFIETGAADAGIISRSLALSPALRDKGRYAIIPLSAHPPIEQGGAIMIWTKERVLAEQFCQFLTSEQSCKTFKTHGFSLP